MTDTIALNVTINNVARRLTVPTHLVLADLLRDGLNLKGCKIACDSGTCGACTVLVDGRPMAACSTFAFQVEGARITTIEGLGDPAQLDVLQEIFLATDAYQCGFCTPGMILAVKALLAEHPEPDEAQVRAALGGNLCRCTGYRTIVDAVMAASRALRASEPAAETG